MPLAQGKFCSCESLDLGAGVGYSPEAQNSIDQGDFYGFTYR